MSRLRAGLFLLFLFLLRTDLFSQNTYTCSIFFPPNVFVPSAGDEFILEAFLIIPDSIRITHMDIHGYTDDIGNSAYNDTLSARRATQVRNLLVELGVDAKLIRKTFGQGEKTSGGTDKDAEKKRAMNRRVDVTMYYDIKQRKQPHHSTPQAKPEPVVIIKRDTIVIYDTVIIRKTIVVNEIETKKEFINNPDATKRNRILPDSTKAGDKITLPEILFEGGTRKLLKESYATLDLLAAILQDRPGTSIKILGHICCAKKGTDGVDDETGKKNLSVVRAKEVYRYLLSKGIDKKRLAYKGMKADFKTGKGAHFDRRVEIEITKV
jgi:outer membrane protein OmpA-like peptidoglycan-associated protein